MAKEEPTRREKGKAKDTVGERKGSGPARGKEREQQPEAGPSRIRATSPLPNKRANTVPQPSGAAGTPASGARDTEALPLSGAAGAAQSRAERALPPKPPVPQPWKSKFLAAALPPKTSKAPRTHGMPTDEMARFSVRERPREGAPRSHRRLGSLEEDMEIDGEDGSQGSKRKRGDEGEREYSDGEEEKDDDRDDDGEEERKVKRPRAGGSKRKTPQGTGKYYNPPCEPCEKNGMRCEKQKKAWACVWCAKKKVVCRQGQGEK